MGSSRPGRRSPGIAALLALWLLPAAAMATDFTWTGKGKDPTLWSDGHNWRGGAAPQGAVGRLTFPATPCPPDCSAGVDLDVTGITADALSIDDGFQYEFYEWGQPITLGAGGLTATTRATARSIAKHDPFAFDIPFQLAASQTWSIDGGPSRAGRLVISKPLTGRPASLTIELRRSGQIGFDHADIELGPVSVTGDGVVEADYGTLNSDDGSPVSVSNGATLYPGGPLDVGPLTVSGGRLYLGETLDGVLTVSGPVSLDAKSTLDLSEDIIGRTHLAATGDIDLGGAKLGFYDSAPDGRCLTPALGATYTVVKTSGGAVQGAFGNVADGSFLHMTCTGPPTTVLLIRYASDAVKGTVLGPRAGFRSRIGTTNASVSGRIGTGGQAATWHFEFGRTRRYGSRTPARTLAPGAGAPAPVSARLPGLRPGTRYHYRLVVAGPYGTLSSPDRSFRTRPAG